MKHLISTVASGVGPGSRRAEEEGAHGTAVGCNCPIRVHHQIPPSDCQPLKIPQPLFVQQSPHNGTHHPFASFCLEILDAPAPTKMAQIKCVKIVLNVLARLLRDVSLLRGWLGGLDEEFVYTFSALAVVHNPKSQSPKHTTHNTQHTTQSSPPKVPRIIPKTPVLICTADLELNLGLNSSLLTS